MQERTIIECVAFGMSHHVMSCHVMSCDAMCHVSQNIRKFLIQASSSVELNAWLDALQAVVETEPGIQAQAQAHVHVCMGVCVHGVCMGVWVSWVCA